MLPLDDRLAETFDPDIAGRPRIISGDSQLLFPGMRALNEDCILNVKNRSHTVTAELVMPEGGANGVILCQGGITGGWSFYLKDGRPKYHYNWGNIEHYEVGSDTVVPAGEHQVRVEFAYDGGGLGKGGTATLYVDGNAAGSGRIERTVGYAFSLDETSDVGVDSCSPVCDDYPPGRANAFGGEIKVIRLDARRRQSRPPHRSRHQDAARDDPAVGETGANGARPERVLRPASAALTRASHDAVPGSPPR